MIKNILRIGFVLNLLLAYLAARWAAHENAGLVYIVIAALFGFFIIHVVLIFLQFVVSALANKGLAGMSLFDVLGAYLGELRSSWLTFAWRQPWLESADANQTDNSQGKRGVLFVHGYFCNRALWREQMAAMHAQGMPHMAITLEPAFGSISAYANAVHDAVEKLYAATGLAPVIVGHSMGGLAARAYVAAYSAEHAQRIITLGTPHHGTFGAAVAHGQNTREMRLNSPWLQRNAAQLNTDVRAKFLCFYSNGDNIVAPFESAMLEGADNKFIPATGHVALAFTAEFEAALAQALKA